MTLAPGEEPEGRTPSAGHVKAPQVPATCLPWEWSAAMPLPAAHLLCTPEAPKGAPLLLCWRS